QRSRRATGIAFASLLRIPEAAPWRRRLVLHIARIEHVRATISDGVGADPAWTVEIAGFLADTDRLWIELVRPLSGVDAVITQHLHFNRLLAAIYDQSGRERSIIAAALSKENTPPPVALARLNQVRGELNVNWSNLYALALQGGFLEPLAGQFS